MMSSKAGIFIQNVLRPLLLRSHGANLRINRTLVTSVQVNQRTIYRRNSNMYVSAPGLFTIYKLETVNYYLNC